MFLHTKLTKSVETFVYYVSALKLTYTLRFTRVDGLKDVSSSAINEKLNFLSGAFDYNYNSSVTQPNKFISKLSKLLGKFERFKELVASTYQLTS